MNVLIWLTILSTILISGCTSLNEKPIIIESIEAERIGLDLPMPEPLSGRTIRWVVITPDNAKEVWEELKSKKIDLVLFAITDDGYKELSLTMSELRNYIVQQRTMILKYKEYYEPIKVE
jgi:hypothetical protein